MEKLVTEARVKELTDVMIEAVDELGRKISITQSGIQGAITPTSIAPTAKGMYPVSESGVYTNFKDSNDQPISITQEDFESGIVFIVFSGTSSAKVITPIPANGKVKEGDFRGVNGEEVYLFNEVNEGKELLPDTSYLNLNTPLRIDEDGKGIAAGWFELRFPSNIDNSIIKSDKGTFIVSLNSSAGVNPMFWIVNKISNNYRNKEILLKFKARKISGTGTVRLVKGNVENSDLVTIGLDSSFVEFEFVVNIGNNGLTPYEDNRIGLFTTTSVIFEITEVSVFLVGTGELSKRVLVVDKIIGRYEGENVIPEYSRLDSETELVSKTAGIFEIRYASVESNYINKQLDYFSVVLNTDGLTNSQENPSFWAINKISSNLRGKVLQLKFDIKGSEINNLLSLNTDGNDYLIEYSNEWKKIEIDVVFGKSYNDMRLMFYYNTVKNGRPGVLNFNIKNIELNDTSATITDNIKTLNNEVEYLKKGEVVNRPTWSNFPYKIIQSDSIVTVVGIQGDSWTQGVPNSIHYARDLSRILRTKYGNGGGGYYDFALGNANQKMESIDPLDANDVRTGVIVNKDQTNDAKGVNFAHSEFYESSTIELNVTTPHTKLAIHYYTYVNGGTFRYKLNSETWKIVDTDSVEGYKTIDLPVSDSVHTLKFEVLSGMCIILGVDMQRDNGIRLHKLGNRGLKASDINKIDLDNWSRAIESLALDSMTILLGTNDKTVGRTPLEFKRDMLKIVESAKKNNEYLDVALISPSNNRDVNDMKYYSDELKKLARELNIAFIDLIPLFGSRDQILSKGTFFDSVHPTINGGEMIAKKIEIELF